MTRLRSACARGAPADPTIIEAYPRPDWYFLWYFALLALIPSAAETLVILGFPLFVGVMLLLLPLVASRGERAPSRRPWAVGTVIVSFVAFVALTYSGLVSPWSPILEDYLEIPFPAWALAGLTPEQRAGADVFQRQGCHSCHAIGGVGGQAGPDLSTIGARHERDYLIITILRGRTNMPAYAGTISREDTEAVVLFLETLQGPR